MPIVLITPVWRARRANTLGEDAVIWRSGWLYVEYEYVLWEVVVLLRKAIIVSIPDAFEDSQTRYLAATCLLFFATILHALLLPYSGPYAVSAQCELVSLLCTFAVFACGFFGEGLADSAPAGEGGAAGSTGMIPVAVLAIVALAVAFFCAMLRLVSILERCVLLAKEMRCRQTSTGLHHLVGAAHSS